MKFSGISHISPSKLKNRIYMKITGSFLVLNFFAILVEKRDPFQKTVKAIILVNTRMFMRSAKALDENLI